MATSPRDFLNPTAELPGPSAASPIKLPGIFGVMITRFSRNLRRVAFIVLAFWIPLAALAGYLFLPPLLSPIRDLNASDLEQKARSLPPGLFRLKFDAGKFLNTEVTRKIDYTTSYYSLFILQNATLVINSSKEITDPEIVGEFSSSINGDALDKIRELSAARKTPPLLPIYFEKGDDRIGYAIALVILLAAGIFILWFIRRQSRRLRNHLIHPACRTLAHYGPPEEIAIAIDAEYQAGFEQGSGVTLTQSWLIRESFSRLDLMFLGDVVFVFGNTQYMPHNTTIYTINLHDNRGQKMTAQLPRSDVEGLLQRLYNMVPWAVNGADRERGLKWQNDKATFIAEVQARKQRILAERQSSPLDPPSAST